MKNIEMNKEKWIDWMTNVRSPFITKEAEEMGIKIDYEIERGSLVKLKEEASVDGFYAIDMETGGYNEFIKAEKEIPFVYMGSVIYTNQVFRLHLFLYNAMICGLRSEKSIKDGVWGIEKLD